MGTLTELKNALNSLSESDLASLERSIRHVRRLKAKPNRISVLDLPPLNLGDVLKPLTRDDDLLSEMLDDLRF